MGLSPLLVDTYRRYKRDTKTFTQWLGKTARATGLVDQLFEDCSETPESGNTKRRKGRNRKPRNQAAAYKISVNVLRKLATAIRDAGAYNVPRHIMTILADVIRARKGCATWYRTYQDDKSETTKSHNEGHQHIVQVLEEVYQVLLPLEEKVQTVRKEPSDASQSANLFSLLEVEECPDLDTEEAGIPRLPTKARLAKYEPEVSPEDVSFAIYCFMKDMTDIRIFIRRTWREYKHKQITLNTAATTVDTAINIMRRLNETFVERYPEFAEHKSLIDYLYNDYVDPHAKDVSMSESGEYASYEGNEVRLSSKIFLCDHTTAVILQFYNIGALPMYQRHMMEGMGISDEEHTLLQCLSHLNIVDCQTDGIVFKEKMEICLDDHILRAVRLMRVEKKFPTWAVFACQVFVDTRRELGSCLASGFQDLQEQGKWLLNTWTRCIETGKCTNINNFHELNGNMIEWQVFSINMVVKADLVQHMIKHAFKDSPNTSAKYDWGSHFLLKNHPLMCGLILQDKLVRCHALGTRVAADQGPVRAAIHLTHAVALAGAIPLGRAWADLDYIVAKHGDAYLFVGERPTNLWDCHRRMSLAFGLPVSRFSVNKARNLDSRYVKKDEVSPSNQKRIRRLLPIARYVNTSRKLDGNKSKPTRAAQDPFVMMELLVNRLVNSEDTSCPANPFNEKNSQKAQYMTPLQTLGLYKQALKEDDLPLRFDLDSLNWRCTQLLRRIQKICVEQSPLDYTVEDCGGDRNINTFVTHMLIGVAGKPRSQPTRFLEACALVREIIAEEGNIEYLTALARMGIVRGTAVDPKDDPEDFEDPDENFVLPRFLKDMRNFVTDEMALCKSRGQGFVDFIHA